ncbi:hypothetical protein M427DRAFT_420137 [Gonapodya prolifera JEL478]|uniref:DNase I-like protein n=1 Tax=Gonapodya prolifera (strain JEL478) TaxID=1344416 RepID=A0A139A599_GONPJ|nr:hypothetical protein M427DRAFT_420137 [Gonapodya prolifera JEL478]|eukprot:KXS11799.1 hypothetical protein M427DRAFT_420137 [Gonapodya prolifera JEL478]
MPPSYAPVPQDARPSMQYDSPKKRRVPACTDRVLVQHLPKNSDRNQALAGGSNVVERKPGAKVDRVGTLSPSVVKDQKLGQTGPIDTLRLPEPSPTQNLQKSSTFSKSQPSLPHTVFTHHPDLHHPLPRPKSAHAIHSKSRLDHAWVRWRRRSRMARDVVGVAKRGGKGGVQGVPLVGEFCGSDHRPVVAVFEVSGWD